LVRIAPGAEGVSIWSSALFSDPQNSQVREFLTRVFSVKEVGAVEIRRTESFGRVLYDSVADAREIWRKLSRVLRPSGPSRANSPIADANDGVPGQLGVENLFLEAPGGWPIRINRVGAALSTWRLRFHNEHRVRLSHPLLLNRKDVAYRLEEELSAILGVEDFRTNTLSSSVVIRFDPDALTAEQLIRSLERSWPRLLEGLEGPPSTKRFVVAGGILALATTGQYFVPAVKPLALLGEALYAFTNVRHAAKDLIHGQVGLPALSTVGLTLTLIAASPFSSSLVAVLMQLWPYLAHRTMTRSQRQLFAAQRRSAWARLVRNDGSEITVDADGLKAGELIAVREGDAIPVDGVVTDGLAAVDQQSLAGTPGTADKTPGDKVYAATVVRDGRLTVRVEKTGTDTIAGFIASRLPHGRIDRLPSSAEAERIANRNVKPALAIAGVNFLATRRLRASQAVLRPDYATAPRLSTQLAALHDLGDALRNGILFRDSGALDRLTTADIYVFDDSSNLERLQIEVAEVFTAGSVSAETVLAYATAAFPDSSNEQAHALFDRSDKQSVAVPAVTQLSRHAGAIRYLDSANRLAEVAAPHYVAAVGVEIPPALAAAVSDSRYVENAAIDGSRIFSHSEPNLRPLWVLREGQVLGVVTFRREREPEAIEVIAALQAENKRARLVYISSRPQAEVESVAEPLGISTVIGGLRGSEQKAQTLIRLGGRSVWIGDGSSADAIACAKASGVSVSIAGLSSAPSDVADVILLQRGLRSLLPLTRIVRAHRGRIAGDYRAVYAANLFGAVGGLLGYFGSLESGMASNLGTGYVYARNWLRLRNLTSTIEDQRDPGQASIPVESGSSIAPLELVGVGSV
jgi:cation transport ATPase